MRKNILLMMIMALLAGGGVYGQASKVTSAWNYLKYDELDKAKDAIELAVANESTKDDAKTWYYRGLIYERIYKKQNDTKKPEFKNLSTNALGEAYSSLKKAIQLDGKNKMPEIRDDLSALTTDLFNTGANAFNNKHYDSTIIFFTDFKEAIDLLGPPQKDKILETLKQNNIDINLITVELGFSQEKTGDIADAKVNYGKLIDQKYDDEAIYVHMAMFEERDKDTVKALETLEKGINSCKKNTNLVIDKLNIYLGEGKPKEAVETGKQAITLDPKNATIYVAIGGAYSKMGMTDDAKDMFKKAYDINPNNFGVNYSIGLEYFNEGAVIYNKSLNETDLNKIEKLESDAKALWQNAIPYLEKGDDIYKGNPNKNDLDNHKAILESLSTIYAKLGDLKKSQDYRARLKAE